MSKDPYQGLNDFIRRLANECYQSPLTVGKVLTLAPLRVRADGLDLTGEDLYMAQHLLPGWVETLSGLSWPLTATLPKKDFQGWVIVNGNTYTTHTPRPEEIVKGNTCAVAEATHGRAVQPGDLVLMLRAADGQSYYILEKLVNMNGVTIPNDPVPDQPESAPGPGG